MKILLTTNIEPLYSEIPGPSASFGGPGTINQTYLHAKHLRSLGHQVYVVGITSKDIKKGGVRYLGLRGRKAIRRFIMESHPDIIMAEGGTLLYDIFGNSLKKEDAQLRQTTILQVIHNMPSWEKHARLNYIDYWCYVADSQKRFIKIGPRLNLFNATLWESVHSKTPDMKRKKQILVIGAPLKPGIREAVRNLQRLKKEVNFNFLCLMPVWFQDRHKFRQIADRFLDMNIVNLNQIELSKLLKASLAVVATFNPGEQCPVTILDAYATGTLCVTGQHGSLKYLNPAGIRCEVEDQYEVFKWILKKPKDAIHLGAGGLKYLKENRRHLEQVQKKQLEQIVDRVERRPKPCGWTKKYWRIRFYGQGKLKALKYYANNRRK